MHYYLKPIGIEKCVYIDNMMISIVPIYFVILFMHIIFALCLHGQSLIVYVAITHLYSN